MQSRTSKRGDGFWEGRLLLCQISMWNFVSSLAYVTVMYFITSTLQTHRLSISRLTPKRK